MTGTLFVVATPIGNLEDITLRAIRVLKEATVIAAEDTRRTARLLGHYAIATRTISFHEHNSRSRVPLLVERLLAGESVALVTDAGTPAVSDPGIELVQACVAAGIAIDPVPGASAPLAAAIASGFPLIPWTIFGFPPTKASERAHWMDTLAAVPHTASFFEAPHRIQATLVQVGRVLGKRQIMVGRELTKKHQECVRGTADEIAEQNVLPRGEFTIVVGPQPARLAEPIASTDDQLAALFWQITESGTVNRRSAIAQVAKARHLSSRDVYAAIERTKLSR